MIHSIQAAIKPRLDQACALGRSHVEVQSAVFSYGEFVQSGGVWDVIKRQTPLIDGMHYSLNTATGQITLLPADPLWSTLGLWRAADTEEPLLYKGRVTHPQQVDVDFNFYAPAEVSIVADKAQVSDEDLTLTVTSEVDADMPIAIYSDGRKIGAVNVTVNGGTGTHIMSVGANVPAGQYVFRADPEELDPVWNLPIYGTVEAAQVEVV